MQRIKGDEKKPGQRTIVSNIRVNCSLTRVLLLNKFESDTISSCRWSGEMPVLLKLLKSLLSLTLLLQLIACTTDPPSPGPSTETPSEYTRELVGQRVVSKWSFLYESAMNVPGKDTSDYHDDGYSTAETIRGTFKVIELEYRIRIAGIEHSKFEFTIEGTAEGSYTTREGASRMIQQGFYYTQVTSCPETSHSHAASYVITGTAEMGRINIRVSTDDYDDHERTEWPELQS